MILLVSVTGALVWGRATPKITWSQPQVTEFLVPGGTRTIVLTFRSNQALKDVGVLVVPALATVVGVTPTKYASIAANKDYQLKLTLKAPTVSQVRFDGTIHLRSGAKGSTYAEPVKATVVIHKEPVPPDPGQAGNLTIQGIDSDNDGVRDDIQRYIVLQFLDSPPKLAAARQLGKAAQDVILTAEDRAISVASTRAVLRAKDCITYIGGMDLSKSVYDDMRAELLNTTDRSRAWLKAARQFSGQSYKLGPIEERRGQCEFDVE